MKFQTATNANGVPATFTWTTQDHGGTANGGVDTLTESLTITVTAVNDQPVRSAGTDSNPYELEASRDFTRGLCASAYGPGGGSDESGQTLTYTVTAIPSATLGSVV